MKTTHSFAAIFALAALMLACSSLDKDPSLDYNGLRNRQPIKIPQAVDGCEPIDAGACSVSFRDQIMPLFDKGACWNGCHFDLYDPRMKKDDPLFTWDSLRKHVNSTLKKQYINPCSKDPSASYIVDNLKGTAGELMPRGSSDTKYSDAEVATFSEWVSCGAPYN
jgi:hypothetical protein